jgi:hypothetical protein
VTLAAFDPFPGVKAAWAAAFSGFHALAVDNARRGAGLAPFQFSCRHDHQVVDRPKQTAVPPVVKVALHGGEGREIQWQQASLATGGGDVLDRIHHAAKLRRARAGEAARTGQKRRDQAPFTVRQIA